MLFLRPKLHAETDVRLILESLSARPNSLRVWNVDLHNPLEFGRYATARYVRRRLGGPLRGYFPASKGRERQRTRDS